MPKIASLISQFKKDEVEQIFRKPKKRIKTEWFDVLLSLKKYDFGRILVITSRKIGNAPKRNKIRRRLKSIFYEDKLYELPYDCVVIAKKEGIELSFDQLKTTLLSILKSSG